MRVVKVLGVCAKGLPLFVLLVLGCASRQLGTASVQQVYPNGSSRLSTQTVDGVLQGECQGWHSTGRRSYSGHYVDGKREGEFLFWAENGEYIGVEVYANGVRTSDALAIERTVDRDEAQIERDQLGSLEPWWKTPHQARTANFPTMNSLSHRSGVTVKVSTQNVRVDDQDYSAWRTKLNMAIPLSPRHLSPMLRGSIDALGAVDRGILSKDVRQGSRGRSTLEFGARWLSTKRDLAVRLSGLLPLAGDDITGHRGATSSLGQDVSGSVGSLPRSLAVRSEASYRSYLNFFNLKATAGVDYAWDAFGNEGLSMLDEQALLARFELGVGIATTRFGFSVEFTSVNPLLNSGLEPISNLSLSVGLRPNWFSPMISLQKPLSGTQEELVLALSVFLIPLGVIDE